MSDKNKDGQQEIINKLKHMPEIYDSRDKEEVYSRVSSQLKINNNKSDNKKKFIPVASAAAAVIFLIILMPVLINTNIQQTSEEGSLNEASDMGMDEANENDSTQYNEESRDQEKNEENGVEDREISIMQAEYESLVVQDTNQNENIYFAGVSDAQEQYIIPIAFIASGERDLQTFYNNMDKYVQELENSTGEYMFENVEFQISQSDNEVALELPDDFSFDGSTAMANMFENILSTMFRPYGTEKVTIRTDGGGPAELDPFGQIDEMPLQEITPSSYKLYEMGNTNMLIRIPNDEQTGIEEAIMSMKEDEPEFHVFKSVPENIQFRVEPENNQLSFIFSDDTSLTEDQDSLGMIEAVLMTAKSYGYEQVSFYNANKEYIGPYNLSEPVPVPEAVNPIYLDE